METNPQNTRINGVVPSPENITATADSGFVAQGEAATRMVQLMVLRRALKLEIETGMKASHRGSPLKTLQSYGITSKRTKRGAYTDLDKYIVQCGGQSVPLKAAR